MFRAFIIYYTFSSVLSLTLNSNRLVHLESVEKSVTINGARYRESSTTLGNSQFTLELPPGHYNFGKTTHKLIDGVLLPRINKAHLTDIQIDKYTHLTEYEFVLDEKNQVGISYHVELYQKPTCKGSVGKSEDITLYLLVGEHAVTIVDGVKMSGTRNYFLDKGFHSIKIAATNNGKGLWGSYPSTGNGFMTGRYITAWKYTDPENSIRVNTTNIINERMNIGLYNFAVYAITHAIS